MVWFTWHDLCLAFRRSGKLHALKGEQTLLTFRLSLASLMPPISHPPPTWRRFAATFALFLFLLLPTPPPFVAIQPTSTPPSNESSFFTLVYDFFSPHVAYVVLLFFMATIFFFYLLCVAIFYFCYFLLLTFLPSVAAQLASLLLSDEFPSFSLGNDSIDIVIALAFCGGIFLFLFLFCYLIFVVLYLLLIDPEEYTVRSHCRLDAPRGLDPTIIKSFPIVVYSAVKGNKISEALLECVVCLKKC